MIIGLSLDEATWTLVERLIEASRENGIEFMLEELQYVVANNDKKWFALLSFREWSLVD